MSVTSDLVAHRQLQGGRVYEMGKVPASPTYPYTVIGYSPNAPEVRDLSGGGDPLRRFTVQHFGKDAAAVEDHASRTFAAFDGQLVAGDVCVQEVATPLYRDADDNGVLTLTHTYRF